jgi:hypothetical protein
MVTTIQISSDLQGELSKRKIFDRETYEEVIWALVEDTKELSKETKNDMAESRKEFKEGKFSTLEEVEQRIGL